MRRIRITFSQNPDNPSDDLRNAARLRRNLWAHSPLEIDPDSSVHGTHRDENGNAYFEFLTNYVEEVERALREHGTEGVQDWSIQEGNVGPPCDNCGNIAGPSLPTICPTCSFRNIASCPYCKQEVARQAYLPVAGDLSGDLFKCPQCGNPVRLRFNDPLYNSAGYYNQPLTLVERVEVARQ